jgi:glycosyltransferase involved in cell wall biosynthesis
MRILAITNLYPNPFQPHRAPFKRHQLRILGTHAPLEVIAPISWVEELQARRSGKAPLPSNRRVVHDGLTVFHPRYVYTPRVGRRLYGHWYKASIAPTFRREVESFRPDIIFGSWAYPDGWAIVKLARSVGLPVVIQVHGSDIKLVEQHPSRRRGTREAVIGADGVMAVSEDLAGSLVQLGVPRSRIRVVYDGIDLAHFQPGSKREARAFLGEAEVGDPLVLFIGNLLPVKGVDVLLAAASRLENTGMPIRLVLIGEGPLRGQLEQRVKDLGLGGRVRFLGSIDQFRLPKWYQAADLFVLPSHSEGVPNVLLEASACNTPWVASRVGGIPEIVDRGRASLVTPNRPDELAEEMRSRLDVVRKERLSLLPPPCPVPPKTREQAVGEVMEFLSQFVARTPRRAK